MLALSKSIEVAFCGPFRYPHPTFPQQILKSLKVNLASIIPDYLLQDLNMQNTPQLLAGRLLGGCHRKLEGRD